MIFETKENKFKPTIRINYNKDMQPQVTEAPNMNRWLCCATFEKEIDFLKPKNMKEFYIKIGLLNLSFIFRFSCVVSKPIYDYFKYFTGPNQFQRPVTLSRIKPIKWP